MYKRPLVSVILPVYNGEKYLEEAIESILNQTYKNYELIVVDDGSTDSSRAIVEGFNDKRLKVVRQSNQGLSRALNRGLRESNGKYIARMDSDDVSMPKRLEKQVEFLENAKEVALIGTWADIWLEGTKSQRAHRHPTNDLILHFELLFNNPFVHSSVMIRKSVLEEVGGYCENKDITPPEDFELWSRIARKHQLGNIGETLHRYREVAGSISRHKAKMIQNNLESICKDNLEYILKNDERSKYASLFIQCSLGNPAYLVDGCDMKLREIKEQVKEFLIGRSKSGAKDRKEFLDHTDAVFIKLSLGYGYTGCSNEWLVPANLPISRYGYKLLYNLRKKKIAKHLRNLFSRLS